MNDRDVKFRVGVFLLGALIMLVMLVAFFSGMPSFFKQQTSYSVLFSDAPGIAPGTPVRRSGVRIGEVTALHLDDATGQVRVHIAVEKPYTLHRDEIPTIVTGFLGGDATIDLLPLKAAP